MYKQEGFRAFQRDTMGLYNLGAAKAIIEPQLDYC